MKKQLTLRYNSSAPTTDEGWEKYSLPIGNGYSGASIFGGADVERVQFTTNTFANVYKQGGVSNFAELYLRFPSGNVTEYERGLRMLDGVAYSYYHLDGVAIHRESFFSYPDRVFVYRVEASSPIDFSAELVIPYLGERSVLEGGRTGGLKREGNSVVMQGTLPSRELLYEGRLSAISDGQVCVESDKIRILGGKNTVFFFVMGTSYKLCEEVFLDGGHKAFGEDPHEELLLDEANALALGYEKLYARHAEDYAALASRVTVDLGGREDLRPTDELLAAYQKGEESLYLEEVYYAYGRHLLICSSRQGTPPASLQGVWTVHDKSPWGSGFWHNINVQMNYWPAFSTNLAETFEAYTAYFKAYLKQAQLNASQWIASTNPENYVDGEGECGWILGTGAFCYEIEGRSASPHSGPGTGGLTSQMFWDYYDFTRDEGVLSEIAYPAIHGMAHFLTKAVRNYDGEYLCSFSASPEQILSGDVWINQHRQQKYYLTVGCAFDQQMAYENACADLACAELLGVDDDVTRLEREQVDHYSPVQIGYSGQVKEFGEEHFYGEIGEAKHRHISQLVALMPGGAISRKTPAWLDAAKITLQLRGDESTGWALAHRFCAWARTGDGEHAYLLLKNLLKNRTYPNLWDVHPPFQIDGNFGAVAGITEMLLQSHGGVIALFPSMPKAWNNVSFKGLKARGNFTISASYVDGQVKSCEIESVVGGKLTVFVGLGAKVNVVCKSTDKAVSFTANADTIELETTAGETYLIGGFARREEVCLVENAAGEWTETGVRVSWQGAADSYAVYRAVGNDKDYTLLGETTEHSFTDGEYTGANKVRATYKIVAGKSHSSLSVGALVPMHPASRLEEERYHFRFQQTNLQS